MIVREIQKVERTVSLKIKCDVCGKEYSLLDKDTDDNLEAQEFTRIEFEAGYGTIFEDGEEYELHMCQHCLKEKLGKYLRRVE